MKENKNRRGRSRQKLAFTQKISRYAGTRSGHGEGGDEVLHDLRSIRTKEKYFEIFIIAVLLAFGIYHSILYFGHQVVPNPDFHGFIRVGHRILSFNLPGNYKRVPVLGILVIFLSKFTGGVHPDLTAGWLLNAILHPFNIVWLWLIGKRIVGRAGLWVAIVAILNPWVIQSLTDPVVETTFLFFILLTCYLILRHSSWSYLFASIATMARYEGAVLILAAFVIDMIYRKTKKQRFLAFGYSVLASVPLLLWMLGTAVSWKSQGGTHYLKVFGAQEGSEFVWYKFINTAWYMAFSPLFVPAPMASNEIIETLHNLSKVLVSASFVFGAVYGLCKRRWDILALLIFLVPYVIIHSGFSFIFPRFAVPMHWIVMLICVYAFQSIWQLIDKGRRIPRAIVVVFQGILLVLLIWWVIELVPYLAKLVPISRTSASMPYVGCAVVAVIFLAGVFVNKAGWWRGLVVSSLVCLIIVSNQFVLVRIVGNGQRDVEFKLLADWHLANAEPNEKILTTMPSIVRTYAPSHGGSFVHTSGIKADNPSEFVQSCYKRGITYVTWDSRLGFFPKAPYYKRWRLENIAMLGEPRSIGPYEFITQIRVNKRRLINIFRLNPQPQE